MNTIVADLMQKNVLTISPKKSVKHTIEYMEKNQVHTLPIVNQNKEVLGIITSQDLNTVEHDDTPIRNYMHKRVYQIPQYSDVHVAARVMRNHNINHLVVTHEKEIVGIISAFDLLSLVENHRFVMKQAPSETKRKHSFV